MEKEKILAIIKKIQESEDVWKVQYIAMWNFIYYLKGRGHFDEKFLRENLKLGLPASEKKYYEINPERLIDTLGHRDNELKYIHLVNLFSLFDDLLDESSKVLCSEVDSKIRDRKGNVYMHEFFKVVKVLEDKELEELKLARETRNCYVHGNKIDSEWLKKYKEARGEPIVKINDDLDRGFKETFHEIEKWNKLIVKISEKIEFRISGA